MRLLQRDQDAGRQLRRLSQDAHPDARTEIEETYHESNGVWAFLKTLPKVIVLQYVFRSIPYPTRPAVDPHRQSWDASHRSL